MIYSDTSEAGLYAFLSLLLSLNLLKENDEASYFAGHFGLVPDSA